MTKYDVILDKLNTMLESEIIDEDTANELNQAAFEKYADEEIDPNDVIEESDEDITLADAMDYVKETVNAVLGIEDDEEFSESADEETLGDAIDDLEARISVAYESGALSEDDAVVLLDLIDIENYE